MTNAEARFNKPLRPRKPEGSLGRTAQDVHLDSHTAPELWFTLTGYLTLYRFSRLGTQTFAGRGKPYRDVWLSLSGVSSSCFYFVIDCSSVYSFIVLKVCLIYTDCAKSVWRNILNIKRFLIIQRNFNILFFMVLVDLGVHWIRFPVVCCTSGAISGPCLGVKGHDDTLTWNVAKHTQQYLPSLKLTSA